jgi:hypothetical protein
VSFDFVATALRAAASTLRTTDLLALTATRLDFGRGLAANFWFLRFEQVFQLSHEFLYILEVQIYRGEANVGLCHSGADDS